MDNVTGIQNQDFRNRPVAPGGMGAAISRMVVLTMHRTHPLNLPGQTQPYVSFKHTNKGMSRAVRVDLLRGQGKNETLWTVALVDDSDNRQVTGENIYHDS